MFYINIAPIRCSVNIKSTYSAHHSTEWYKCHESLLYVSYATTYNITESRFGRLAYEDSRLQTESDAHEKSHHALKKNKADTK